MLATLKQRQLIVVTGKGGVGKSVLCAALAGLLAEQGRRTLALEVDPRENLHQLLDVPPSDGELVAVGQDSGLHLQNLKPGEVVDWLVESRLGEGWLARRVKRSPVYQRFAEGAPGIKEMAILGHALRVVEGKLENQRPMDTVVLDAPATGHGLYLLNAPRLFAEAIGEGPFHRLADEVAEFVADPERTGLVVVTLAEEMPVDESLELWAALQEQFGRRPELLVVNGLYPALSEGHGQGMDPDLVRLWQRRRQGNEREMQRLTRDWEGPRASLPLLPLDRGPELLSAVRRHLQEALDGAGGATRGSA